MHSFRLFPAQIYIRVDAQGGEVSELIRSGSARPPLRSLQLGQNKLDQPGWYSTVRFTA